MSCSRPLVGIALIVALLAAAPGAAQVLPSEPLTLAGGTIVVSGTVSGSVGPDDEPGYFNYTDYEHTALRMFRAAATVAWYPNDHIGVLTEVRLENTDVRAHAWYLRVRPWADRAFDVQIGRIPPSFGAYARRSYGTDDPFIAYPLAYQYLSSLRADALPATADDVLRQRGRGWRVRYPIGDTEPDAGLPLVSAFEWDTGLQVRIGARPVSLSAALTQGALSHPLVEDDNGGKQISGRLAITPAPWLAFGISAASGAFVSHVATGALPPESAGWTPTQAAFGADLEVSGGHWLVRSELVVNRWSVPAVLAPLIEDRLRATGVWVEARYRVSPRWYVAGRADHLGFSTLVGTVVAGEPTTWDAPVTRGQITTGYYLTRNIVARGEYQYNWRDGGRPHERGLAAAQILYWF